MKNKKGFTLIELLAIIVILAIIAVITVPIILGIIEDSKKGSAIDSAYGYIDGVDLYNASLLTKGEEALDGIFYVDEIDDDIKITGDKPVEGYVELVRGKVVSYSLKFGEYVVTLDKSTGEVTAVKNGEVRDIKAWAISCDNPDYNPTDESLFTYIDNGDNTVTITGYNGDITDVRIPCTIDGKSVMSIGRNAFRSKQLTSVIIPSSVTNIGDYAFYYNELTNLNIPSNVTSIGREAFRNNQLTSVTMSSGITSIGRSAFESNQLTSVVIPDSVTSIEIDAFRKNQLTNITIPNSVISLSGFRNNKLTSVDIPNSVTSIGAYAFYGNQLTSVSIPTSVTSIGTDAFRNNKLTSVTIPSSVTSIGNYAFYNNRFKNVEIPSNVTSIGNGSFAHNGLESVSILNGVTSIGNYAFADNNLTNISIPGSVTNIGAASFNGNYLVDEQAFIYARNEDGTEDRTTIVSYGGTQRDLIIPNGVKVIGSSAFDFNECHVTNAAGSCLSLANFLYSVVLPEGLISIGSNAFTGNRISSVVIPSSVTSIGGGAFSKDYNFWSITTIYNNTGRSFDWKNITYGSGDATFVTGTVPHNVGDITVTTSN